ncbi:MAG: DNA-processing protein DprA [Vicinamibacterales bacterium]
MTRETWLEAALLPPDVRRTIWSAVGRALFDWPGTLDDLLVASQPSMDTVRRTALTERSRGRARAARGRAPMPGVVDIVANEPAYPPWLLTIPDPPFMLWARGLLDVLSTVSVAVVGSRAGLPASLAVARELGRDLAGCGLAVVSGLARGVDSAAHQGALESSGGVTVAVFGAGLDRVYPPEHRGLADAIAERGVLLSEHPPGTPPKPEHFPLRNRIISGLSVATVVVEASDRSGSLTTARCALDQGRDVMVVPGSVAGGRNRGGHALLRDGAALVESAADVIDALPFALRDRCRARGSHQLDLRPSDDVPAADGVLGALQGGEPSDLDALVSRTGLGASALLARLAELELQGRVVRDDLGRFLRSNRKC